MSARRGTLLALVLCVAVAATTASPVSAADAPRHQSVPVIDWTTPGTEPLDGIGQWVYVAPIPPAGPAQAPTTGYVYGPSFILVSPPGTHWVDQGTVGLSTDDQGPIAGIYVTNRTGAGPVIVRYDWSPGKFYFLVAYGLGGGAWGGWVYDHSASTWTFIGTAQGPTDASKLRPDSGTAVLGAEGQTVPAFSPSSQNPVIGECSAFPRVDAYFSPTVAYRDTDATLSVLDMSRPTLGNCPTETTVEGDWVHFRLGALATA